MDKANDFFRELVKVLLCVDTSIKEDWLMFGTANGTAPIKLLGPIANALAVAGMGLTIIYFLLELNNKVAFEGTANMTPKSFIGPFAKFALAVALISQGPKIMNAALGFNDWAISEAKTIVGDSGASGGTTDPDAEYGGSDNKKLFDRITEMYDNLNIIEKCFLVLVVLLEWIVSMLLGLVWMYKAIMYKIEYAYRVGITPLAFADAYSGQHSNVIKWFKGFLALSLYGASLILAPKLATVVAISMYDPSTYASLGMWAALKVMASLLVAPFAALAVTSTIKQMTKEALA